MAYSERASAELGRKIRGLRGIAERLSQALREAGFSCELAENTPQPCPVTVRALFPA